MYTPEKNFSSFLDRYSIPNLEFQTLVPLSRCHRPKYRRLTARQLVQFLCVQDSQLRDWGEFHLGTRVFLVKELSLVPGLLPKSARLCSRVRLQAQWLRKTDNYQLRWISLNFSFILLAAQ